MRRFVCHPVVSDAVVKGGKVLVRLAALGVSA